ncbi:DUF3348 family protein [Acidovorax sp. A1169]|uniref:DUF3348 family protein n=1 Tax=Acidovorax sp. A1169 TaxID=3059524 RepID=UPI002737DD5E|nr:DUF3348 family protein [Acidovorax sp. A1169]
MPALPEDMAQWIGFFRMPLPHRLDSSRLVVLLAQWTQAQRASVGSDVAGQLGQWLSVVDAVELNGSLRSIETHAAQAPVPQDLALDALALEELFQKAKADLTRLATAPAKPARPVRERADNTPVEQPDPQAQADFAAHGPRYLEQQKQMDMRLVALRTQVRAGLLKGSATLRQLAALDGVMEQMLGAREQRLWASLPGHLERRFVQLRKAHQARLQDSGQADDPLRWRRAGGWLASFEQDLQALLLAEMQVRLQPITGLLEAARNENKRTGIQE